MSDDYLWDRSGAPDPEIARLEELLAPLAQKTPVAQDLSPALRACATAAETVSDSGIIHLWGTVTISRSSSGGGRPPASTASSARRPSAPD